MPSKDLILESLAGIANNFQSLSALWHFYFAVFLAAIMGGARPTRKTAGMILSLPLFSVGLAAWAAGNPFNGTVFLLLPLIFFYLSLKLSADEIVIAPLPAFIPGIIMIIFGWIYPHFLNTENILGYLYKAPTGIIPCATLSIVIGFTLLFNNLNSKVYSITLSLAGFFYGITGTLNLGVSIDYILFAGSALLLFFSLKKEYTPTVRNNSDNSQMTVFGVGPRLAFIIFPFLALALAAHFTDPGLTRMSDNFYIIFPAAGAVLILVGLIFWASGGRTIIKAFNEKKLLTNGVYSIVRNPMYSGILIFITTGAALWMRSWALLTIPFIAATAFWFLIKEEEKYLEELFGKEYQLYKSSVRSLIPFIL